MSIWEAIILGALQGLTEFLPVSSSGHLELAHYIFGIHEPNNLQFTMFVHLATVLSTIVVFGREIWRIICGVLKLKMNDETIFALNIFISLLPIIFVGFFLQPQIEGLFEGNLTLVGSMLLLTATLLTFSHFAKPRQRPITPQSAFIIGIAQAVAVLPGLSRSGSTISAGLLQGVKREEVAKFSFLMVLIPIIGMNFLEVLHMEAGDTVATANIIAGFVTAFVFGTVACKFMIRVVNRGKLIWFAAYCAILGIAAIARWLPTINL